MIAQYTISGQSPTAPLNIELGFPAMAIGWDNMRPQNLYVGWGRSDSPDRNNFNLIAQYWSRGIRSLPGVTRLTIKPEFIGGPYIETGRVIGNSTITLYDSDAPSFDAILDGTTFTTVPANSSRIDGYGIGTSIRLNPVALTALQQMILMKVVVTSAEPTNNIRWDIFRGILSGTTGFAGGNSPPREQTVFSWEPDGLLIPINENVWLTAQTAGTMSALFTSRVFTYPK